MESCKLSDMRYTHRRVLRRNCRYPDSPHNPIGDTDNSDTILPLGCWGSHPVFWFLRPVRA